MEIVVGVSLEERLIKQIAQVGNGLRVQSVADIWPTPWPETERVPLTPKEQERLRQTLAKAEVLLMMRPFPDLLEIAPRLKWLQLISHGIEQLWDTAILQSGITVTSAQGAYASPIAEHVVMLMLMLVKQYPRLFRQQQKRDWDRSLLGELQGQTLGLLGLGSIGQRTSRLAKDLGMRVLAVKRSPTIWDSTATRVDEVLPRQALEYVLQKSDFVVIALPYTPETHHFIGEAELRTMKPTAYLINVGRGGVVDEQALTRALKEGWIAGAGLDVFEQEPLPQESELWQLPNVVITPHVAGVTHRFYPRITQLFCNNLKRYLAGEELLNRVDSEKGY